MKLLPMKPTPPVTSNFMPNNHLCLIYTSEHGQKFSKLIWKIFFILQMMAKKIKSIKLEVHPTKNIRNKQINGSLTVVWRDWDNIIKNHPKMVYVSSVKPREIKGPHVHTKRNSYFVCIRGKVVFIIQEKPGVYSEIESSEDNPILVFVPKNIPSAHINISNGTSSVLALADIAWRPNDNEMKNFSYNDYDWRKWKNSSSKLNSK